MGVAKAVRCGHPAQQARHGFLPERWNVQAGRPPALARSNPEVGSVSPRHAPAPKLADLNLLQSPRARRVLVSGSSPPPSLLRLVWRQDRGRQRRFEQPLLSPSLRDWESSQPIDTPLLGACRKDRCRRKGAGVEADPPRRRRPRSSARGINRPAGSGGRVGRNTGKESTSEGRKAAAGRGRDAHGPAGAKCTRPANLGF